MPAYSLRIADRASTELDALDGSVGRRILKRIRRLADNFDNITPIPLAGEFAGLYKLRVGDYRVIYEIKHDYRVIVIQVVGHRSDVYRHLP